MFAEHNFERAIINGLGACKLKGEYIKSIVVPGVGSFPFNNRSLFQNAERYSLDGINIRSIGFINLPIINKISIIVKLVLSIFHYSKGEKRVSLLISTATVYLQIAVSIVRSISPSRFKVITIINDIPVVLDKMHVKNTLKWRMRSYLNTYCMRLLNKNDGYVLMTEAMMDFFPKTKPHIVMEGIINDKKDVPIHYRESEKKVLFYAGSVNKIFGIIGLIDAFEALDDKNTYLWICGSGDAAEDIIQRQKKNDHILYLGLLSPSDVVKYRNEATVLVNPRTSEGEYTKYSFPSKTIEYLLSGIPVIMNRLPGIPDEYFNYVFTPLDESIPELTSIIRKVLNTDTAIISAKTRSAREFILSNKNSEFQVSRIIDLIKSI